MESCEDPTKVCQICNIKAKAQEKFYGHYGTICCYSCKAFFRRYSRGEIRPKLCKNAGKCEINKGRLNCKPCRYTKCQAYGMSVDRLLNEEQRKKYTHLKKNKKESKKGSLPIEEILIEDLINEVQVSFSQAVQEGVCRMDSIQVLVQGHMNIQCWSLEHSIAFLHVMESYILLFKQFAVKIGIFKNLPQSDQDILLEHNAKLFQGYIIARYLAATKGVDQLECVLGLYEAIGSLVIDSVQTVNFQLLNQEELLISYHKVLDIQHFQRCLDTIKESWQLSSFFTPLFCHYLTSNTTFINPDDYAKLVDKDQVKSLNVKAEQMIQYELKSSLDLDQLVQKLYEMSQLINCTPLMLSQKIESRHTAIHEREWIKNTTDFFLYHVVPKVPPDPDMVGNRMSFSFENSMGLKKLLGYGRLLCQTKMSLLLREGFGIHETIPETNIGTFTMIVINKSDTMKSAGEMIKYAHGLKHLGDDEDKLMAKPMEPMIKNPMFRKLFGLDPLWLLKYENAWKSIGVFLRHSDIFVLVTLVVALHGLDGYGDWSKAIKTLLFKRINDYCILDNEIKQSPSEIFQQFLTDVKFIGSSQKRLLLGSFKQTLDHPIRPPPPPLVPINSNRSTVFENHSKVKAN